MEFPELFSTVWWVSIVLGIILYRIPKMVFLHLLDAYKRANELNPYFNPPGQLFVNDRNEWETKPGRNRSAWWRTFWTNVFDF